MRFLAFALLLLAGCAGGPAPSPSPSPSPSATPAPQLPAPADGEKPAARTENIAVAGLMSNARADTAAGRLSNAAATLERALRIEPRNPRLWHELAQVRLKQGEYAQAESLAARSSQWAGNDAALRAANQKLVEQARTARGK